MWKCGTFTLPLTRLVRSNPPSTRSPITTAASRAPPSFRLFRVTRVYWQQYEFCRLRVTRRPLDRVMSRRLARSFALMAGGSSAHQTPKHHPTHQTSHQLNNDGSSQVAGRSLLRQLIDSFRIIVSVEASPKDRPWTCPTCGGLVIPKPKK